MKIQVTCKVCGRKICEAMKPNIAQSDLDMYEKSSSCEEHGPNTYEYDEDGIIVAPIADHIVATKIQS